MRKMVSESSRHHHLEKILQDESGEPCSLPLQMLRDITNNFSEDQELGRGGFGVVYKGVLQNGQVIAVKKFFLRTGIEENQFENEINDLMTLKHNNIVRCVGYCYEVQKKCLKIDGKYRFVEHPEMLLCLEYLPKGSLEKYMSDGYRGLDWQVRYKIIVGICHGLYYLHDNRTLHLDIKPANILLGYDMEPKITDFGLSRLLGREQSRIYTKGQPVGILSYMAPEYLDKGLISIKSDIFSVGVVIIEIIVGNKDYPDGTETSTKNFVEQVLQNWRNRLEELRSASLEKYSHQIKVCTEIGLSCVHPDPVKRPTIREIIKRLNRCDNTNLHVSNKERTPADMGLVSASLGAMAPLLRKLDLIILDPKYPLRRSLKQAIRRLKEDLEELSAALKELSVPDSPNQRAKYWMCEVRELSYDVEDFIDDMISSHTAAVGIVRSNRRHRVARLKICLYPKMLKASTRIANGRISLLSHSLKKPTRISRVAELRTTLLWGAMERHERYELDGCVSKPRFVFSGQSSRIPVGHPVAANLVGIDGSRNKLTTWLTDQAERQLKVYCIVGFAGVGKTALAKELYRELGGQFECGAFVRVSRKPDMSRLFEDILSQIQGPIRNSYDSLGNIIDKIREHLRDKRYFIVIDDLWDAEAWGIVINNAFPKGNNCSRIIITCEVKVVAAQCCVYYPVDVHEVEPLRQDSDELFFSRVFGSKDQCPDQLKDVASRITGKCGGLPLAIIAIASLLASEPDSTDLCQHLLQCFFSSLINLSLEEMLKEIMNLCYNSLPQDLKTCLLYLTMYPEGYAIWKVDLIKQWTAEGFSSPTEGKERIAETYFVELVNRGMIQPEKINHDGQVLSCTVHHIVLDLISRKSKEANFITAVDYSQTIRGFSMKAHRMFLHFSVAQYASKPEGLRLSQVRSLAFYGFLRCMPSIMEFKHLRIIILEFWREYSNRTRTSSLNLSRIDTLFQLRYLKISSHFSVELPSKISGLKFLETLEIDASVSSVPDDIVLLPGLLHLSLQDETKLPEGIGGITSLQTLQFFDLGIHSVENVRSLGKLRNLRDLHLTCSTGLSDEHLKPNLIALASSLKELANLKYVRVTNRALSTSSVMFSAPMFLERIKKLLYTS